MGARPFDRLRANGRGGTAAKLDGVTCADRIDYVCEGLAVSGGRGVAEAFAR